MNRIFGADYFLFYNLSVGPNVDKYIRYYVKSGLADVIQWQLPRGNSSNNYDGVYYYGQVAALSDCLLRTLNKSTFIAFIDVDEIIVPRAASSLADLMEKYEMSLAQKCGLLIRNAFFRMEWSSDPTLENDSSVVQYNITSLIKTKRESLIRRGGNRSKYIAKVKDLLVPAVHVPYRCKSPGWRTATVTDALLHHYRSWGDPEINGDRVNDTFLLKYSDKIIKRIRHVHNIVTT